MPFLPSCSSAIVYNPWEPLSISHVSVISGQAPGPAAAESLITIAMTRMKLARACAVYQSVVYAFPPDESTSHCTKRLLCGQTTAHRHHQGFIRWAGSFQRRLVSNLSMSAPRPRGDCFVSHGAHHAALTQRRLVLSFWEALLLVSVRLQTGVL